MLDEAKALVLASHDVGSLRTRRNRAVLLAAGTIVGEGSVEDVWKPHIEGVERASEAAIAEVRDGEIGARKPPTRDDLEAAAAR